MGHREDLLAGTVRCLYAKGYAKTTARDIVAASGTNLASIGYHYGSKDSLMHAALFQILQEWIAELSRVIGEVAAGDEPMARFETAWARVLESFAARRDMWAVSLDVFTQMDQVPQMRQALGEALQQARVVWATVLSPVDRPADVQALGSFCQALLSGVLVQWLVDPQRAPSGTDLAGALRAIAAPQAAG
jgi:AcrR family transcriptional regulator